MPRAYYNEVDPYCVQWLRNLIEAGMIADGDVDSRSIREVSAEDLIGYDQVHLFAGIGIWSYALREAGWKDDRAIWSGSCPCQPFSVAGRQKGNSDERHLWPEMYRLIRAWQPPTIIGEQVGGRAGYAWLDIVQDDLEREGYEVGAADLAAAGAGAPHIRQRVFWVADNDRQRCSELWSDELLDRERETFGRDIDGCSAAEWMADTPGQRYDGRRAEQAIRGPEQFERSCDAGNVEHSDIPRPQGRGECALAGSSQFIARPPSALGGRESERKGFWDSDVQWIWCRDNRWRPAQSSAFPLAHGDTYRVDSGSPLAGKPRTQILKAIGNAIVAPVATEFVKAYMAARGIGT